MDDLGEFDITPPKPNPRPVTMFDGLTFLICVSGVFNAITAGLRHDWREMLAWSSSAGGWFLASKY